MHLIIFCAKFAKYGHTDLHFGTARKDSFADAYFSLSSHARHSRMLKTPFFFKVLNAWGGVFQCTDPLSRTNTRVPPPIECLLMALSHKLFTLLPFYENFPRKSFLCDRREIWTVKSYSKVFQKVFFLNYPDFEEWFKIFIFLLLAKNRKSQFFFRPSYQTDSPYLPFRERRP
jgi:hypothetical protein